MNYFSLLFVILNFVYVTLSVTTLKDDAEYILDSGTKRYYLFINPSNFFQAFQFCRTQDMQLLTINSAAEQTEVESILKATNIGTRVWTSGTRLSGEIEFFWLSTGRVVRYSNWQPRQPDNNNNGTELCLEILTSEYWYQWNDVVCNAKRPFICEEFSNIGDLRIHEVQSL